MVIFLGHMQVVSIIGNLKLLWPPSVGAITSFLDFDFLAVELNIARPDCVLNQIDSDVGTYYLTNGLKILTIAVAITALPLAATLLGARCGSCSCCSSRSAAGGGCAGVGR